MGRLASMVGLGVVLLVMVAGCGGGEQVGYGGQPPAQPPPVTRPTPVEVPPDTLTPPAGASAVPPARVEAAGLPAGFPTTVWTTDDGRRVGLFARAGGCTTASADVVSQDAQRVVIRLVQTTTSEGFCPQVLYFPPVTVQLDAPLGERTVVLVMPRATPGPPPSK